jgi:hypothetical protein
MEKKSWNGLTQSSPASISSSTLKPKPEIAFQTGAWLDGNDDRPPFGFRADLPRWQQLVAPAWLAEVLAQAPIVAAPAGDWRLFEIGFGAVDAFIDGHIAGAAYIDTLEFESAPLWN